MSALHDELLTLVLLYGYPVVAVTVFAAALGVPLPATAVLLAAGALTVDDSMQVEVLIPLVAAAALAGDCAGYALGRWLGYPALLRHGPRVGLTAPRFAAVHGFFQAWAGPGVFLTRWLLTPLASPLNLLAGATGFAAMSFVSFAGAGELLWSAAYVGLGYVFGTSWTAVSDAVQDVPATLVFLLIGLACVAAGLWLARRPTSGRPRPVAPRPPAATPAGELDERPV